MDGTRENFNALANAIVIQAAIDYRDYHKKRDKDPDDTIVNGKIKDLERFFNSRWFGVLTGTSGDVVLEWIKQNADSLKPRITKTYILSKPRTEGMHEQ